MSKAIIITSVCFIFPFLNPPQSKLLRPFPAKSQAAFARRSQTDLPCRPCLWDVTSHSKPSPCRDHTSQTLRPHLSRRFCRETLHAPLRIRANSHRNCANAQSPLATAPDSFVYSPQRSTRSATVQWLFSMPAAIAVVIFKAPRVLTGFDPAEFFLERQPV